MIDKPGKDRKPNFGIIPIQTPKLTMYLWKVALAITGRIEYYEDVVK